MDFITGMSLPGRAPSVFLWPLRAPTWKTFFPPILWRAFPFVSRRAFFLIFFLPSFLFIFVRFPFHSPFFRCFRVHLLSINFDSLGFCSIFVLLSSDLSSDFFPRCCFLWVFTCVRIVRIPGSTSLLMHLLPLHASQQHTPSSESHSMLPSIYHEHSTAKSARHKEAAAVAAAAAAAAAAIASICGRSYLGRAVGRRCSST